MAGPPPPPCWPPPPLCPSTPLLPSFTSQIVTTSAAWPVQIRVADANLDGCPDVLVATSLEDDPEAVLQSHPCSGGAVAFAAPTPIADNGVWLDVADFTGDGTPDVLLTKVDISGSPFFPNLYLQTAALGAPSPSPPVSYSETVVSPAFACPGGEDLNHVAVSDLNGDGFVDAVVGCDGSVLLFLNDASNSFAGVSTIMTFAGPPESLELVDLNGDGSLDVVAGEADTTYHALNLGGGSFAPQAVVGTPGGNDYACAADFDGDGNVDLVSHKDDAIMISLNDGMPSPGFATGVVICPAPADVYGGGGIMIECGDVNGDGLPDVVVASIDTGTFADGPVTAFLSCGGGVGSFPTFYEHEIYFSSGTAPSALALADLNGDGALDVLLGSLGSPPPGTVTLLLNDGATASPTSSAAPSAGPTRTAAPSASARPSPGPSGAPSEGPTAHPTGSPVAVVPAPCVTPPDGMVGWWPFDEPSGAAAAADIAAGANDAALVGSVAGAPGVVGASAHFDGVSQHGVVPHTPDLNFPGLKFTIDFWIRPDAGELYGTIVRKGAPSPGVPNLAGPGYHLWYNQGHFFLAVSDGSLSWFLDISPNFTYHADPEVWTFVAVVADYSFGEVRLYVDGVLAKVTPMFGGPPSVPAANAEPLVIAGLAAPLAGCPPHALFFAGRIDELEVFDRTLTAAEVLSIYDAGSGGKCKDSIHVPWDKGICVNKPWVNSQIEICNNGNFPASYEIDFGPIPANGANCLVSGPVGFEDPSNVAQFYPGPPSGYCVGCPGSIGPKTVGPVGPGACHVETFRIYKPPDLTLVYSHVSCFSATVTNLVTGQVSTTMGSIQGIAPCLWVEKLTFDRIERTFSSNTESEVLVPGVPRTIYVEIFWDDETEYGPDLDKKWDGEFGRKEVVDIVAVPYNSDMTGRKAPLSINGGRSGEEHRFSLTVPPANRKGKGNEKAQIALDVLAESSASFSYYDIVFYRVLKPDAFDSNGEPISGNYTSNFPISSMGFRTTQSRASDSDGDGISDLEEVAIGFDPYLGRIELSRLSGFYTSAIQNVMDGLNMYLQGPDATSKRDGRGLNDDKNDRTLHADELEQVYQIFWNASPSLPVAMDELAEALDSISMLKYYEAIHHVKDAISALEEVNPNRPRSQCQRAAKLEEGLIQAMENEARYLKGTNTPERTLLFDAKAPKSRDREGPAPEVAPYIRPLNDATERLERYLSLLAGG